jgi:hypothetical protein
MAAIGRLPETLADRCIVIRMQRKTPGENCERLKNLDATPLRQQCARFAQDHAGLIADARPQLPPGINDRASDVWEPLLALADVAGGDWPELARGAAQNLTATAQESSPSASLLLDILMEFAGSGGGRIFSRELVAGLNQSPDRPWSVMRSGREIDEVWQQLRPYGIRPRSMRIGKEIARGYTEEDFKEVFRRYIPRSDVDGMLAESGAGIKN